MKNNRKAGKGVALLMALAVAAGTLAGCSGTKSATTDEEEVTLTFLNCWQGSSLASGIDMEHNPVADIIAEKTGVRVKYLACTTTEMERLNLAFATNDIPDIIDAPFWGGQSATTLLIKKAATEGLLYPLNDLIKDYGSNLKKAFTYRIDTDYRENDIEPPEFNGEHYVIPTGIPATDEDVRSGAYNAYIRKDILLALNVDPKSVDHSEKLYELMKKIKAGNFKDANGNDIIVSGTWHSGWTNEPFFNSYVSQRDMFSQFKHENGQIKIYQNTERKAKQILFMRKLIAEGLYDVEAPQQTSAIAKEKMATGKVAIIGSNYATNKANLENTLYKTNPEMEYVPLGPILNLDGEPYQNTGVSRKSTMSHAIIIGANTKYPEKIMKFLNFMNSEEGIILNYYGIEGVHHKIVDGKPRLTDEWLAKYNEDPDLLKKEGIGLFSNFVQLNQKISKFGETTYGVSLDGDERYNLAAEASPITFAEDVYSLNYLAPKYPKWEEIQTLLATGDGGLLARAMFAKTEEEAWDLINQSRAVYEAGGIKEFEAWMTEHQHDVEK